MSEKHGQLSGAQWTTKSAAAAGAAGSPTKHQQPNPNPNSSSNSIYEATATSPYGIPIAVPPPPTGPIHTDIPTYTSGRFQAPPLHMHPHTLPAKSSPLTIVASSPLHQPHLQAAQVSPSSTTTNVPAPSGGFVPPVFPNMTPTPSPGSAAAAGATSVLTPNPFVAASAAGNLAFVNAFNLSNANLDLGKIMHAMNANAAANAAVSPAAATATTVARHPPPAHPHPSEAGAAAAPAVAPSGAINATIAENVMSALSSDDEKMRRVQQVIEASLDDAAKLQIAQILESVSGLKPIEKLFLYLRLPGESADTDPLRQPQNPLGTRSEINHTINWVRSHLEHDAQVSIPKQDVYNDYIAYCERLSIKPLSTADFGKVMKQVFPGVRPRRLGTRGNSRYCYAAMRKTTKLTPPQLPQLCKDEPLDEAEFNEASAAQQLNRSPSAAGSLGAGTENDGSWDVVRNWAEKLLNTKLDSVAELATRIKTNNAAIMGGLAPKKYTPREPKEKRLLADMGPLKKRRKKKRKGSTSSESSCNQPNAAQDAGSSQEAASDEHKTEQLLKIKQEIIDSPGGYTSIKQLQPQQQQPPPQQQQQQQVLPMNLATDQRSNAVRNLTPKLMELQTEQAAQQSPLSPSGMIIKDEADTEEYNTSNIFCKKVLKAQQTKGFWANSPSSGSTSNTMLVPPVITTTAATPPPPAQPPPENAAATVAPLSMGPPAQLNHQSSVSPSSSLDTNSSTPKVASRNMMLLRAKRIMAENAAALAAAAEDSDLPENLGLPRERVISICNMDKHELDDYFLPGDDEEENSEGPDTELLQYFPIGDAEEKQLNSLDAQAEQHRNPQAGTAAATALSNAMAMAATAANARSATAAATATTMQHHLQPQQQQQHQQLQQQQQQQQLQQMRRSMPLSTTATVATAAANVVGSASASLALMSRKHQQQQQQQHQQLRGSSSNNNNTPNTNTNNSNKRKISLTNASSNGNNKNCIFLPISPNTNSSNPTAGAAATSATTTGQQNCFASPGLTRMRHRSNLLTKQQSLDFDNNGNGDPMIGAGHRRRRNYVYSYPSSSSASAPPSPSLLQQCMGANWSFNGNNQFGDGSSGNNNNSSSINNNVDLLVNQNSMDLETSLALSGANIELNETQRSQSVPLSQLQRSSSNQSPATSYNSQMSHVVVTSIVKDVLFSENSNSQQSKLGGGDVDVSASLLYDDVDVSALISPNFNSKFTGIQTTTTCSSSAGSSSGYSSAGSAAGGIVSRSVPSTPLPHQQSQQQGCNSNSLNTTNGSCNAASGFFNISPAFNWTSSAVGGYGGQSYSSRTAMDISKSMPTTPITTPCFRYSPVELHRDFLINGNTIDSLPSPAVAAFGADAVLALSTDTLIDDAPPHSSDVEAMIGAVDMLDNL
ncbi:uncharacterized protein LOC132784650 [Drosophila nasuta]|uniref:uncharacterized protein LOC132784650 n=1 Tax=Drosophila nasuta TaxID=42062 RepID=UPI00295E29F2|nr:uncharacterized protein LOC132784650 [Drosophila nasuta]